MCDLRDTLRDTSFLLGIGQARAHWHPEAQTPSCTVANQVISAQLPRAASPAGALVAPQHSAGAVPCRGHPTELACRVSCCRFGPELQFALGNMELCCH